MRNKLLCSLSTSDMEFIYWRKIVDRDSGGRLAHSHDAVADRGDKIVPRVVISHTRSIRRSLHAPPPLGPHFG